ncbi:hypothetical protein CK203_116820 [Vitis vinifera]|uniref:Uncharacterized protein n=1 Tax=Vitis vinifera TaxID=29760 RepID=A0A438CS96_VITVI|nr:hypothetical protein CK203_116820 [Vitis vinifera]
MCGTLWSDRLWRAEPCEAWEECQEGWLRVESKTFEVEVEERRGRLQATIVERKGGISSWVRLGPQPWDSPRLPDSEH